MTSAAGALHQVTSFCTAGIVLSFQHGAAKPSMTQESINIYGLHDEILRIKSDLNNMHESNLPNKLIVNL